MILVTCAIIIQDEKVLVAQRSENMSLPLKWEFPGGKVEEGEDWRDCLMREIKEELNVSIDILFELTPSIHEYPDSKLIKLIPFVCTITDGIIQLKEHKQIIWAKKSELLHLDWAEADISIVNDYIRQN